LKDGLGGACVYLADDDARSIRTCAAESFFKIGSGDVFAAAFAHSRGELHESAINAAEYAARCLAYFVDGHRLPLPDVSVLPTRYFTGNSQKKIRILSDDGLFEPSANPDPVIPAFVLIGSSPNFARLEMLSRRVVDCDRCVVFWPNAPAEAVAAEHRARFRRRLFGLGIDESHIWADLEGLCATFKWRYTSRIGIGSTLIG
jgi:hypothetical protein